MTVTLELVSRLRRMIVEPTETVYSDAELMLLIEERPVRDTDGNEPTEIDWIPTYDLYAVASSIWLEKAAAVSDEFDFNTDGGDFKRSQKFANAMKQATYYQSRSKAGSIQLRQSPVTNIGYSGYEDLPYKDDNNYDKLV